jgi:ornithine carbamoyltransferase
VKDLLRTADLDHDGLLHLLELAESFKRDPDLHPDLLRGRTVVLSFATPSTRTRLSFEAAVARLGGTPVVVGPAELQLGRGETIRDTARVVSGYAAALVICGVADEDVRAFAAAASIPVVNALTDGHQPCQSLADLLTIREHFHHFADRKLAYLGDGNNVTNSLLEGAALVGMDITVATPPGFEPSPEVVRRAEQLAEVSGSWIELTADPHLAVKDADIVYTDAWLSVGDAGAERPERREALARYRVTAELLAEAAPSALFMHCLPAHRGDEVAADVIDGPQSVVFEQAANRLPTAQAVLDALVEGHFDDGRVWC